MGYLPKHMKVKRHNSNMRAVATAALAGWTTQPIGLPRYNYKEGNRIYFKHMLVSPAGGINGYYNSRARAAHVALMLIEEGEYSWR